MGCTLSSHFAPDYRSARKAFLAAAEARGAALTSHVLPTRGPANEELAVDAAWLGPDAPRAALVLSSGIHGIEGFAGSAIQHRLLVEQLAGLALPDDVGLLLVHALNPWGFASLRRVNESNVDLNRNFLRHPDEHVANPGYDELFEALNPVSLDAEAEAWSRARLLGWMARHGMAKLQQVVTGGQYVHPDGMQFGGVREEASSAFVRRVARDALRGARRVVWLDLHTGLGPWAGYELVCTKRPGHPVYRRGCAWFGEANRSTETGESASASLRGSIQDGIESAVDPDCEISVFGLEIGTYEPTRVLWAIRADNWLAHHGELESEAGRAIKAELQEVFGPADPLWRQAALDHGSRVLAQACDALSLP